MDKDKQKESINNYVKSLLSGEVKKASEYIKPVIEARVKVVVKDIKEKLTK